MSCIEAEQKGFAALASIFSDLVTGTTDSCFYSSFLTILVAFNLVSAESMGLDAFLEFVSPHSGLREIFIAGKLIELSQFVVIGVVDDNAYSFIGFVVAAYHP